MFNRIEDNLISFFLSLVIVIITAISFSIIYNKLNNKKGRELNFGTTIIILSVVVCMIVSISNIVVDNMDIDGTDSFRAIMVLIAGMLIMRFRSKNIEILEISYMFFSVIYSFILGLGYIALALIMYFVILLVLIISSKLINKKSDMCYILKITLPEDMSFDNIFDNIFEKYTNYHKILKIKLTDMGTTYNLSYLIEMKEVNTHEFLDEIRIINGNMSISLIKSYDSIVD